MEKTKVPLNQRMWAKICAYFLVTVSIIALVGSVIGAVLMIELDMYTRSEKVVRDEMWKQVAYSTFDDLYYWLVGDVDGSPEYIQYAVDESNAEYQILDATYGLNAPIWESEDYQATKASAEEQFSYMMLIYADDEWGYRGYNLVSNPDRVTAKQMKEWRDNGVGSIVLVNVCLDPEMPATDLYWLCDKLIDLAFGLRYGVYFIGVAALILAIAGFIFILCGTGHRAGREGLTPGYFTRIPFDLFTAAFVFGAVLAIYIGDYFMYYDEVGFLIYLVCLCLIGLPLLIGWCASFALRVKLGTWWRNTLIFYAIRLCWRAAKWVLRFAWRTVKWFFRGVRRFFAGLGALIRGVPLVWKTAMVFLGFCFVELLFQMFCYYESDNLLAWWALSRMLLAPVVVYLALTLRKLQEGGRALAAGDLSYQVDDKYMLMDFKEHAENLNSIGLGMTRAVDERMKSERFKTELITNVSHDIKTPLTSIINYSDLIGREKTDNEKVTEYAQVLHRQSERLKKLLEDLLDASKASTGNLEVHLAPCEAGVLLTQAAGEYEQKLSDCGLSLIVKQPAEPIRILADGRHIARVFDNLMNNICKYSQEGTRVYLSLEEAGGRAVFSFKNTSRYALDISSDELMERFVRGDSSRSTEGSGLGLSIARSLTELQNGTLSINVDGDLFKAVLSFPKT